MKRSEISIKNMFEIPEYARVFLDGKLHTEDRMAFEINKIILSNKSLYFEMLFYGPFCNKTEFLIPGISGECLQEILGYLYTGKISLNKENVIEILMASDYLMISELRTVVRENLKYTLTIENTLQLLTLSDLLNDTVIYHDSFRFTQLNFEEIMSTQEDDFTNVSFGILKSLLKVKNLSIDTERVTWLAIVKWVEKRKSERKRHVSLLLPCLALEDLDENTITEITGHDLIVNNSHVKKLNPSDFPSSGNHDHLKSIILKNNPHLLKDVFKSRIPEQLYIIGVARKGLVGPYQLYVSYDENLDVWRKIGDIDHHITSFYNVHLYNIQNNLYASNMFQSWKVDLRNGASELFHNDHRFKSITQIKNKLYFLDAVRLNPGEWMLTFKIYDCNTDSWTDPRIRIFNMYHGCCASIEECIYVVGLEKVKNEDVMTAYVYDTTPPRWFEFRAFLFPQSRVKKLPSPAVFRGFDFEVVAYRHKIFVIGGSKNDWQNLRSVEAFDVESHTWNQLEDLPFNWSYSKIIAIVLNDRLFVYHSSYETSSKIVVWNDHLEKWARIEVKDALVTTPKWDLEGFEMHIRSIRKIRRQKKKSLLFHDFCTIKDKGAISALCRANRRLPFERSRFSEKDTFQQDWFVKR